MDRKYLPAHGEDEQRAGNTDAQSDEGRAFAAVEEDSRERAEEGERGKPEADQGAEIRSGVDGSVTAETEGNKKTEPDPAHCEEGKTGCGEADFLDFRRKAIGLHGPVKPGKTAQVAGSGGESGCESGWGRNR